MSPGGGSALGGKIVNIKLQIYLPSSAVIIDLAIILLSSLVSSISTP